MLEGLVTWVLNNYVGEYLENLNADQISVALLQGQVELENVPLKKSALRKFDIPVQVKSGVIGKLTLSVPITHIRSEPWVLKMSDLLILLGPSSPGYDVEGVEQYEQTKKQQMLDELEQAHVKQLLVRAGITPKEDSSQNQWWGASLVSTVVNNIQLILTNVHIRYEDEKTMPDGTPFNFGIRVQNITVQTTNAQWKQGFVRPADGANIFKKLDIKGLSVFWNCKQEVHEDVTTPDALKKTMSPEVMKNCTFILQPFSMQARMEKNGSKFPLKMQPPVPRFKFDLQPEKIEIELSKRQLAQIRILGREWARFDRARAHRKWRPLVPVNGNSKQWWLFAYHRIVEENRRQRSAHSSQYLTQRARLLNSYCRAYARKLEAHLTDHTKASKEKESASQPTSPTTPAASAVNQEDVALMRQIEHDSQFTYQELNLFRETIFRRIVKSVEEKNPPSVEDSADTFEVVSPESEPPTRTHEPPATPTADGPRQATPTPGQSGGLYGWITSWFSAEQEHGKQRY
ncbi:Protein C25H3.11 [Aphelenchoides avenae]|nr:Protein C25H3.11 [Aphelenchus avenae]